MNDNLKNIVSRIDVERSLTGTAAEVIAVRSADNRAIGNGKEGPITRRLNKAFREYAMTHGTPIGEERSGCEARL